MRPTDREAMQQALEALDRVMSHGSAVQEAKDILRERLAQPCREWVGLTDADIEDVWSDETLGRYALSYAIETKLREKNNG